MTELTPVELKKKKIRKKREWKERNGAFFGTTDEFFDDVFKLRSVKSIIEFIFIYVFSY